MSNRANTLDFLLLEAEVDDERHSETDEETDEEMRKFLRKWAKHCTTEIPHTF